ncbi:MAG TPA: hypothetical protein VLF91_06330 [Candidatus Saccharimonadales bacterium]|nr:hypothetical protein [Candidatus Saccharimonadales bacterium]
MTYQEQHLSSSAFQALDRIRATAYQSVDEAYGVGHAAADLAIATPLAYHNGHHTRTVAEGARKMAAALGLSAAESAVSVTAGAAHDLIQLKPRGVMEQESAEWLETAFREAGIPQWAQRAGSLAILGTEPLFSEDGRLVGQKVSELDFVSHSERDIAHSVACADMSQIHDRFGPLYGHQLYAEIKAVSLLEEPPLDGLLPFQRRQAELAATYRYPNATGEAVFGARRAAVAAYQAELAVKLERGDITSWHGVIGADLAFAAAQS